MKLFLLKIDIDGFGGKEQDQFFYTKSEAVEKIKKHAGFFYSETENKWAIEGIKETVVVDETSTTSDDDVVFGVYGRPYPEEERDDFCIRWAKAEIYQLEVDRAAYNRGKVYVLYLKAGYQTWLQTAFKPSQGIENPAEKEENRETEVLISFSKNHIKKYARSHCKRYPRLWNNKEEEEYISPIGHGCDYLFFRKYEIQKETLGSLSSENVEEILSYCIADIPSCTNGEEYADLIISHGITSDFLFSKKRLEVMKPFISSMCDELPKEFKPSGGGGYTFLNACTDKNGRLWTGMHHIMEMLFVMGNAIGKTAYLLPREIWAALPGGVPYLIVNDECKPVEDNSEETKKFICHAKELRIKKPEKKECSDAFDPDDDYSREVSEMYWEEEDEMKMGIHPSQVKERILQWFHDHNLSYDDENITFLDWMKDEHVVSVEIDHEFYGNFNYDVNDFIPSK